MDNSVSQEPASRQESTSREEKIATLRRNGYSTARLDALEGGASMPDVPNDLSELPPDPNSESGWRDTSFRAAIPAPPPSRDPVFITTVNI